MSFKLPIVIIVNPKQLAHTVTNVKYCDSLHKNLPKIQPLIR